MYHTPPLCFAQQNIGEVSHSDGGVENDINHYIGYTPFLLPCPVALRGVASAI